MNEISQDNYVDAPGTDIRFVPHDPHFINFGKVFWENGWSVFPQTRDTEQRYPGRIGVDECPNGRGQSVDWGKFRSRLPTPEEMEIFYRDCPTLNVAIAPGPASANIFVFDVDCTDRVISKRVQEIIFGVLGPTPFQRIGNAPKAALIYRTAIDDPIRNRSQSRGRLLGKPGNIVEILGNVSGTALTAQGLHHKTGQFFFWPELSPYCNPPTDAPLVTSLQVQEAINHIEAEFGFEKSTVPEGGEMSEFDWDRAADNDYRRPRVIVGDEGKIVDGREEFLNGLVYRAVTGNGFKLLAENRNGQAALEEAKKQICLIVREAFEEGAECSGRWSESKVGKEITGRVNLTTTKLLRGDDDKVRPWSPKEKPVTREEKIIAIKREEEEQELLSTVAPYQALGHDDGTFYILGRGGQVRDFRANSFREIGTLLEIADMDWWLETFPAFKGGVDTSLAQSVIIEQCFDRGVYSLDSIRGRGVWLDAGRTVMHLGDVLLVDGERIRPQDFQSSKFIYEASHSFEVTVGEPPMDKEEATGLVRLLRRFPWEKPGMGDLLAGWCALAPVCGALPWRPHAWLTAEPGTGKSWLLENVVLPVVGSVAINVQGATTEAGLRQEIKQDARPVIFDESEGQTEADRHRIQRIMNLARQSSTGGGAKILLGTSDQKGASYSTKATFLFSSANVSVHQSADQRRWIVATLSKSGSAGERAVSFEAIRAARAEVFRKPDFGARLLSRTLKLLPDILRTVNIMVDALVLTGGDQATAWTVAVPLAGCWHLQHDECPEDAQALEFVRPFSGEGSTAAVQQEPEWSQCLSYLLQQEVDCQEENGTRVRRSIGHLIARRKWTPSFAAERLKELGIKEDNGQFLFAGNSAAVAKVMKGSTWGPSWLETLARAPGAIRRKSTRFTPTLVASHAVGVPVGQVISDESSPEQPQAQLQTTTARKIPLTV